MSTNFLDQPLSIRRGGREERGKGSLLLFSSLHFRGRGWEREGKKALRAPCPGGFAGAVDRDEEEKGGGEGPLVEEKISRFAHSSRVDQECSGDGGRKKGGKRRYSPGFAQRFSVAYYNKRGRTEERGGEKGAMP